MVVIIEAWVLDKVSIILSKSDNFLSGYLLLLLIFGLEVMLVIGLKVWLTLVETRLMRLSRVDVGMVVLVAHDQTDSMRNLDGSSIQGWMFWSIDCS